MASSMWTPSLFHKIFTAVARSDVGVLGALDSRSQTVALNEYVRFMKANNYQKLGLTLTDLTDAFKFANQVTDDNDRNEMTESEFAQCLLFTQARQIDRKAGEGNALTSTNRPPFDVSSNVASQLGPFLVALCGSKLIVQGGPTGKQITEVFLRTPNPSRPSSADDGTSGNEEPENVTSSRHIPEDDENIDGRPVTQREMNAFFQEMRLIFTRLQKRVKANRYLERVIAGSKGGLLPIPSKSEQDERSRLTIEFRTLIHDMNEMNENVRTIDSTIATVDKELKTLLEERASGLAMMDDGMVGIGGSKKMWISAEEENKLKLYEKKLNDRVNEYEKRIGVGVASNVKERHEIQEHRVQIMELKREIASLEQIALGIEFMTNQHGLLTGHVLDEQRDLKDQQFNAIKKLKEMQAEMAVECKKLEAQCAQMDARMQAVENEMLEKPPDRAAMNEMAIKKAAAKLELKETKAAAETLETKMKMMLTKMGITPTYALKEIEGLKPFYYINNDSFLEIFQTFEDKAFSGETEITTRKMRISQLETEISVLKDEYESTMQQIACASEKHRDLIDIKGKQLSAAQDAVIFEKDKLGRTEGLLVEMERTLASINDKLAKVPSSPGKNVPLPVRDVFVPPVPDLAHIRTRKLLEARLLKLLGSRTTVLATDLLCNAGTVDLLCHDRRERLVLVCFANPLTGYSIDTALVSHCSEIQSAFYMLRRLPSSGMDALKNCFLDTGAESFRDILNARVHRFIIIGKTICDDCDTSSFASSVELVKAEDIGEVWHGEATKRALFGGVPSPEELSELISAAAACANEEAGDVNDWSQAHHHVHAKKAWSILRKAQRQGKFANVSASKKVTYQQFLDWVKRFVHPAKFLLPSDTTIDEVVQQFIVTDMKWSSETPEDQAKRLLGSIGPQAIYRYVAQMGEHIKLFSACGVTFTQLSPSPPPPEADSGLEAIVEAWQAAAATQEADAAPEPALAGENQATAVPAKHEVAGGTWMVEAIARLVLRYIGCLPPIKEEEQEADLDALKSALRISQAKEDTHRLDRDLRYQRKCNKKFEVLSHSEEFLLYGHQMVENQLNLKKCEDLLGQFLDHFSAAIASHNKELESLVTEAAGNKEEAAVQRRRQRNHVIVRPPSLSSSDEDENIAEHRKHFEELFIKAKSDSLCESAELIDASALRGEYKSAPITQASNNVLRIDPAVKMASKEKRFHSKVYVGTVHASLKFLPNRNWYPELHAEMRRSLQKFESLTKALSKIKGAPQVISLADEHGAEPKSTKLPKIRSAPASLSPENVYRNAMNDHEVFNQLTLLDHLLRLPAEQLRASSQRSAAVSHAGLLLPIAQPQRNGSTGVSLFSGAAALGDQTAVPTSSQQRQGSSDSPSRNVSFAAEDAGLVKVHVIPTGEKAPVGLAEDIHQAPVSKAPPTKVSPRTRAIKTCASLVSESASSTAFFPSSGNGSESQATQGEVKLVKPVKPVGTMLEAQVAYGSVRMGPKGKHALQMPRAGAKRNSS